LLGIGLLGYTIQFASAGGVGEWLSVGRGGTDWAHLSGYTTWLADLVPLGVTVSLFHIAFHKVGAFKKTLTVLLGGLMLLWFLYLGTRSRTIGFSVVLLSAYYLPKRKNTPVRALVPLFGIMLLVTSFLGEYRGSFTDLSFHLDNVDWQEAKGTTVPSMFLSTRDREALSPKTSRGEELSCVMAVVDLVPKKIDYNYGYALLEFLTRPIPRSLWPDKRYPYYEAFTPIFQAAGLSSHWVPYAHKPILVGPAFTFVGHWYAIGGPIALILAGFLTGALFRCIRCIFDRRPGSEGDVLLYVMLLMIGFSEAASTPLFFLFGLPFHLIPVLLLFWLCREPVPRMLQPRAEYPHNPASAIAPIR